LLQQPITGITGSEGSGGVKETGREKLAAYDATVLGAEHFTKPFRSFAFCYIKMNFCCSFVRNMAIDCQLNMLRSSILRIRDASNGF
jgi:hypothetical protein